MGTKVNSFRKTVVSSILIGLLLGGCSAKSVDTAAPEEERETPVKVAEVKKDSLIVSNEIIGEVTANKNVTVYPKVGGEILTIHVKKGDHVKEGQVLAKISGDDLADALALEKVALRQAQIQLDNAQVTANKAEKGVANAESTLQSAKLNSTGTKAEEKNETLLRIQWEDAKRNLDRMKVLYNEGAISQAEYENAVTAEKTARLRYEQGKKQVDQAKIALEVAKQDKAAANIAIESAQATVAQAQLRVNQASERLGDTAVKSTIQGEVIDVPLRAGDSASAQSPMFTIVSLDPVVVTATVSANQLLSFKKGEKVKTEIVTSGKTVDATITYVSPVANEAGLYTVEAEIPNPKKEIKPGMIAKFIISDALVKDAFLVPTEAIIEDSNGTRIFVIVDGRAVMKEIEILESQSDQSAIKGDIKEGDVIVVQGQNTLSEGNKVKIIEEGTK